MQGDAANKWQTAKPVSQDGNEKGLGGRERRREKLLTTFLAVLEQTELKKTKPEHRLKSGKVNAELMNRLFK